MELSIYLVMVSMESKVACCKVPDSRFEADMV